MAIRLTEKEIRDCLSILDLMHQIKNVRTEEAARRLSCIHKIKYNDAHRIVVFWENNQKKINNNSIFKIIKREN